MGKASQWLKEVDRRKYSKNCFLYRQLLDYTDRKVNMKL
jgi:hypothetical protein